MGGQIASPRPYKRARGAAAQSVWRGRRAEWRLKPGDHSRGRRLRRAEKTRAGSAANLWCHAELGARVRVVEGAGVSSQASAKPV